MAISKLRRAFFVSAIAVGGASGAVACSADKPPAGSGLTSSSSGGTSGGTPLADSGADADSALDASIDGPTFDDDGSCLNDQPSPKMDAGDASPTCPPSGTCATYCADIVSNYKLGLAQTAVACILALADCSDVVQVNTCVDTAVGASCKDTTSSGYCMPLVTACDPNAGKPGSLIDEPGCESIANGLSASGRSKFSACIDAKVAAGTCPVDVHVCTDELRQ